MHMLPQDFVRRNVDLFEGEGVAWLERLPDMIAEYERRWNVHVAPPFALTYNYVAPALRADGMQAVLKLGFPGGIIQKEIAALRHYDGHGIVQLLEVDPDGGAMLIERLVPGTPLTTLALEDDERATIIAAQVMRQLWRPVVPDHAFPTVHQWAEGLSRLRTEFDGGTGPFPERMVDLAEGLFAELLQSAAEPVLLHGDLHHDNILSAERQPWLALDPQGVVGEPAYEVGALLRNPIPHLLHIPDLKRVQARRVDLLAETLELDRRRIVGWGFAQAVLSGWWSYEDHGAPGPYWLACAESLVDLL